MLTKLTFEPRQAPEFKLLATSGEEIYIYILYRFLLVQFPRKAVDILGLILKIVYMYHHGLL